MMSKNITAASCLPNTTRKTVTKPFDCGYVPDSAADDSPTPFFSKQISDRGHKGG